jgi:predicted acylesterase/phospholipase RssA
MRALVLSGGGAKGAFEAGVCLELAAAGRDYDLIVGVSTGALAAVVLGQDTFAEAAERLRAHYQAIRGPSDVYHSRSLWGKIRGGLYSPAPLRKKIETEVARGKWQRQVAVGVVDMRSGEFKTVGPDDPCFVDYVLASCSFPPYFPPVKIWGRPYMDGGLRNIAPLATAIQAGASYVDMILASPATVDEWPGTGWTWDIAGRAITVAVNEVYRDDMTYSGYADILRYEPSVADWRRLYGNIPYIGTLEFDPAQIQRAIEYGRIAGHKILSV